MENTMLAKENTARLVSRAAALGYRIERINPHDACPITCTPTSDYTPEVSYTPETGWVCQTSAYGAKNAETIQLISEGYQRALALITTLEAATDLAPYTRP